MKKPFLIILVIILITISATGCDTAKPNPNPDQAEIEIEHWLTPFIPTDTQDPASIGTLPGTLYRQALSLAEILQLGPEFSDSPNWQIATPVIPSFYIKSAKLHECNGQVYVMINVVNNGPYYFQFITLGVSHGTSSFGQYSWEDPWIFTEAQCPVATTGWPSYAPGWDGGFIYQPVTVDPAFNEYHIHLSMCTYTSIPDACPYRYYLLTEDYSTKTPTAVLMQQPFLRLKELVLCWVGPGPPYEVVNSIPEGTEVELLGKGDKEGFLVVQEPKYGRPCWMRSEGGEEVPPEVFEELMTFITPALPFGEVRGRVFKDQNNNGVFDGKDVGFPGANVYLAPGSCASPGQAAMGSTNNNGYFNFGSVTPGDYCLYMSKPNTCKVFSTSDGYNISVPGGGVVEKSFGLNGCR